METRGPRPRIGPATRGAAKPRIGLALAGGGPLGAIYEIGALCALQESVTGLDLNDLDGYVGVSAGGFIAAGLANGITPRQLLASFIEGAGPRRDVVDPALFFRPAWGEFARRLAGLPAQAWRAGLGLALRRRTLMGALEHLGAALPTGLFTQAPLQQQLQRMFSVAGRSDDFRRIGRRLVIVATDLDSGEAAPFGQPGWDAVPVSQAVAASAALPGMFPPVRIGSRWYVDGALKKTLHASVLLDMRLGLVLCLNPLVPFDATHGERPPLLGRGRGGIPSMVHGGLPLVLSQTFRSLIHSRLEIGIKGYRSSHPEADLLLFEPEHGDAELFLANAFEYRRRRRLAEHAYQRTRAHLRAHRDEIDPVLRRHGLALDDTVLDDPTRRLLRRRRRSEARRPAAEALRHLDEVLDHLERVLRGTRSTPGPKAQSAR